MHHAYILHKLILRQCFGTICLCVAICFLSPSLTPGFQTLLHTKGKFPPAISYFIMDPITKLLAGLIAAPGIGAYATIISLDDPPAGSPKKNRTPIAFLRSIGLIMLTAGTSGFVLWPMTVAAASTPEMSAFTSPSLEPGSTSAAPSASLTLMLHTSCALIGVSGAIIVGVTHGAKRQAYATCIPGTVYLIWMTWFSTTQGAAWAEYAAGILGLWTLWKAASFDKQ